GDDGVQSFIDGQASSELMLFCTKLPDNIFHDYDRAVDDEPEIDCAQAHQVPRNSEARHTGDGEKKCEWNRSCDDQRSAPVPKKEKQHSDDEQRAFEQVRCHGANSAVYHNLSV